MKKRDLILDFTSLLDVIMILLFVVLGNMGYASLKNAEANRQELEQARQQTAQAEAGAAQLQQALDELSDRYEALRDDYDYLKITTGYDENDTTVYQQAIQKTARACVILSSTGSDAVELTLYLDGGTGAQTFAGSMTLTHDTTLSREERDRLSAAAATELTRQLSRALEGCTSPMIWFTVQYPYTDAGVTHYDLEVIRRAVENLGRSYDLPCYLTELKLH